MKRKLLIIAIPLVFAVLGLGSHFGYRWARARVVNREFCEFRERLESARETYLTANTDITDEGALVTLYRKRVIETVCDRVRTRAEGWSSFRELLAPDNRRRLETLLGSDCDFPARCEASEESKTWTNLAEWIAPRSKAELLFEDGEVEKLNVNVAALRELVPLVRRQRGSDSAVLCGGVRDVSRARKLVGFYQSRCPACASRADHRKMAGLAEAEESRLRRNIEQFKIKWSEDPSQALDCLKDF
ncbi:MAG: hypothetical protein V4760_07635 [Bdellovibrionota bacterium]